MAKKDKNEITVEVVPASASAGGNDRYLVDLVARSLICQAAARRGNDKAAEYFGKPLGIDSSRNRLTV